MMKLLFITMILMFSWTINYGQQSFQKINDSLEVLFERIADKDTLIKSNTKYYECSEDLSGQLEFYYQAEKLKLITHVYNQGFRNETFVEHYFIKNDTLRLKTLISN